MAARVPAASRTDETVVSDEAETVPFNSSHFDRLQKQGIIKTESLSQDAVPELDRCPDTISQKVGLHQLELEQAPRLRVLFQQSEGDMHLTLTAEQAEELRVEAPGAEHKLLTTVLGATHSRAEISWSCKARRVKAIIFFIPWKDDILILNNSSDSLFLESVPNGLDMFKVSPRHYAVVYPGFWQLRDHETTIEFLLRPRRYRLLIKDEAKKRPAAQPVLSPKRSKQSIGVTVTGAIEASSAQAQKTIIRPTVVDVDILNKIGLGENQTLNIVDAVTGQIEYSIKCIGRYLKRGSYADVFKAVWDDGSSEPTVVAVKLYKITAAEPPYIASAVNRWKRELQAHRGLKHSCIANLLAFDSRLLALIIEHRDSHDLGTPYWCSPSGPDALWFKGTIDDACRIVADVSSALAYLADHGLVHNDIKAGNILYRSADPTGGIKAGAVVIDFGVSRVMKTEVDDLGGGAPWYLAPEWMEHGRRNPPADVFSLGVVVLYLLRRIRLPDKERGWNVNAIQQHIPEAITSMKDWLNTIRCCDEELEGPGASSKETKLRSLVRQMLLSEDTRITACDLASQSSEWAA